MFLSFRIVLLVVSTFLSLASGKLFDKRVLEEVKNGNYIPDIGKRMNYKADLRS